MLALHAEMADDVTDATVELSDDPVLATWQACAVAPLGPSDRHTLLGLDGPDDRVAALDVLLHDEMDTLEHSLALEDCDRHHPALDRRVGRVRPRSRSSGGSGSSMLASRTGLDRQGASCAPRSSGDGSEEISVRMPGKQQPKSVSDIARELWELAQGYTKQETIDPLKNLGRYLGVPPARS